MHYVYWLYDKEKHKNIFLEGYVGITNNIERRLQEHKSKKLNHIIICAGSKQYCLEIEYKLRPCVNIGLNTTRGGIPNGFEGKTHSDKYKQIRKQMWLGNKNPNYGGLSKSHIEKIVKKKSKVWSIVCPNGKVKTFSNLTKFCAENNLDTPTMHEVLKKTNKYRHSHKGFKAVEGGITFRYQQI